MFPSNTIEKLYRITKDLTNQFGRTNRFIHLPGTAGNGIIILFNFIPPYYGIISRQSRTGNSENKPGSLLPGYEEVQKNHDK